MPLFNLKDGKANKIAPIQIKKEKDIQKMFEDNLDIILNVDFLASEYSTSFGGRIDTLGIDKNNAPVIIEYKKTQNDSVINQALSYLKWLLDHKEKFELLAKSINKIDWEAPRVICVAESYNKFDLDTAEMLPIDIELIKYKLFDNNILQIETEEQRKIKVNTSQIYKKSKTIKETDKLQKKYTIEDHLNKIKKDDLKKIFFELREKITSLDNEIKEEPKKYYIAYKLATNFVDIELRTQDIKVYLNMPSGQLNDPYHIARDLTKPKPVGKWGNGDYTIKVNSFDNLDKVFELIKQSYNYNK